MFARRLFAAGVGLLLFALIGFDQPIVGQVAPKAKAKGVVIAADQIELNKTGAISELTLVQRPPALKGVRSWTWETKIHRWYPLSLAVSADGKLLATGGYEGTIHLWDVETGKHVSALVGHGSYVGGLDFSADGLHLASCGLWDGTARVWDIKTGQPLKILREHKGYTNNVAWSPDGKKLAVTAGNSGELVIWDAAAGKVLQKTEYGNPVAQVVWNKDGDKVAVTAGKSGAIVANSSSLKTIHTLKDAAANATAVAFSPDDKSFLAASQTGMVEYSMEDATATRKIPVPGFFAEYLPDGRIAATSQLGGTALVAPAALVAGKTIPTALNQVKITRDGKTVFTHYVGTVTVWDVADPLKQRTVRVGDVLRPTWAPGHPMLLGVTTSGSPTLWDTANGKILGTLDGHKGTVTVAAFQGTGKLMATGGADKAVRVWDTATGKGLRTLEGHKAAVTAVAIAGDGKVASGSADKTAVIWPAKADTAIPLDGHTKTVTAVAWSKDGATLATGGADNNVILWTAAGKKVRAMQDHPAEVRSLAWSPMGDRLAVGGADDRIRIYQTATGKQLALQESLGSPPDISAVAFSPDGNTVLAGRSNHTLQLWSGKAATKTPILSATVGAPVHAVAYAADGKSFATASLDRCVRFFDLAAKVKTTAVAEKEQLIFIGTDGHYRTSGDAEDLIVAVVLTETGMVTLSPKDFAAKYGFKNVPTNVKVGQ